VRRIATPNRALRPVATAQGRPPRHAVSVRRGYGEPHPQLVAVLHEMQPTTTEMTRWPGGLILALAAYVGVWPTIPDEFVTSVRCLTVVDDQIVTCEVPGAVHVWPGGRRESGETIAKTAAREVHEETGWLINEISVRQIGLLHFQHRSPVPTGHPFPHPDFCQIVVTADATKHEGDPSTWQDSQGWEARNWLVPLDQAHDLQPTAAERALLREVATS